MTLSPPATASPVPVPQKPRHWAWAHLMRHAFDLDVLACPRCGGRLRLVATVEDPHVIRQILAHLGFPAQVPHPDPPQPPPTHATGAITDVLV